MPHAEFSPPDRATSFRASVLLAAGLHAAAFLFWKVPHASPGTVEVAQGPFEVSLVEEAPVAGVQPGAPSTPAASPELPKNEPPQAPPLEPRMVETPKPPEMIATEPRLSPVPAVPEQPTQPSVAPEPFDKPEHPLSPQLPQVPQTVQTPLPKPPDTPLRPNAPTAKTGSSTNTSKAATGVTSASGQPAPQKTSATSNGPLALVKPVYSVQPTVRYPSESRAANEQGTVILRITINADGRPVNVAVAKSSGFNRLDRAAVEGGWRCRVQNAQAGAQFEAPLRFSLAQ